MFVCNIKTACLMFCSQSDITVYVGFMRAYDFVMRKVLHNILVEFSVPMKLVRLIKICIS